VVSSSWEVDFLFEDWGLTEQDVMEADHSLWAAHDRGSEMGKVRPNVSAILNYGRGMR
jgi:hypothetical protein